MHFFNETATVLLNDREVKLSGFVKFECYHYVSMEERWEPSGQICCNHLFGIRFYKGKLELLFDERRRRYSDPQIWAACECYPADKKSSKVLREIFEMITSKRPGSAPLQWPW